MKVAVMSLGQTLGKTALMCLLGGLYSRSQAKNVAILTTGDANDNINIVDVHVRADDLANPYVFKSLIEASAYDNDSLFDYGIRQGDENVFIYNVFGNTMHDEDKYELLYECIDKLPADLTLIEITLPALDDQAKKIMDAADCTLVLFDASEKGIRELEAFRKKCPTNLLSSCGFVAAKHNGTVIAEKALSKRTGLNVTDILIYPFNLAVQKMMFQGMLDKAAYDIIVCNPELMPLRMRLYEIMCFLFDSPSRKVIRSIDRWYK